MRAYKAAAESPTCTRVHSWATIGVPGSCWYTVHPAMQANCSQAAATAATPGGDSGVSDARTTRRWPSHFWQKLRGRRETSKSSKRTTSWTFSASSTRSRPCSKSLGVSTPSSTKVLMAVAFASLRSATPAPSQLITVVISAGNAGTSMASSRAFSGVAEASPPTTQVRVFVSVFVSFKDDNTSGKGIEAPSSCSVIHELSAPSTLTCSSSSLRGLSSPMTIGSSCKPFKIRTTSSTSSLATTSAIPIPQLNVPTISRSGISNFQAIHRKTAGNSQRSALSNAISSMGITRAKHLRKPPLVMGAAPFSFPARASSTSARE
mmetsp:Transcript_85350/g.238223  ORF Transcript_85350/g.238223 Transcript_85350/m.238223 type:complete len:320 (-) Transcript_85350:4244-5203(-)